MFRLVAAATLLVGSVVASDRATKLCDDTQCAVFNDNADNRFLSSVIPATTKLEHSMIRNLEHARSSNSDLHTNNGNSTWQDLKAPGLCYRDLAVVSESVMFAVAEGGFVVSTTDGGKTWVQKLSAGGDYYWYGVHAKDANNVIIAGFQDSATASLGIIRTTTDGGTTWTKDVVIDASAWLTGTVQFTSATEGMTLASLSGRAHTTSDGGNTWTQHKVTPDGGWLADQFWFQEKGNAVKLSGTHDCACEATGYNFTCKTSVNPDGDGPTYFTNGKNGFVGAGFIAPQVAGFLYSTSDGGSTWSNSILNLPWPVRTLAFSPDGVKGFVAGGNFFTSVGGVYATSDGGKTWQSDVTTGMEHQAIRTLPAMSGKTIAITAGCARAGGKIMTRTF